LTNSLIPVNQPGSAKINKKERSPTKRQEKQNKTVTLTNPDNQQVVIVGPLSASKISALREKKTKKTKETDESGKQLEATQAEPENSSQNAEQT
jgi:hypothetical protein